MVAKQAFAYRLQQCRGAQLLEFIISFPIFLAILLGIIWISTGLNAATAFKRAVHESPRLAITRTRMEHSVLVIGTGLTIPRLSCDQDSPYLFNGDVPAAYHSYYSDQAREFCDGSRIGICEDSFQDSAYLYAIAYVNYSTLLNVGTSVKFPCDPEDATPASDGCILCVIQPPRADTNWICEDTGRIEHFRLACDFRPDNFISGPMSRLLGSYLGNPRFGVIHAESEI